MKLSEFDFELPEELIAQHPVEKRDTSRLMVVNRENGNIEHRHFYDILEAVMATGAAVRTDTQTAYGQIHIVVNDIDVLLVQLVPAHERAYRLAAVVHKRLRFDEEHRFPIDDGLGHEGVHAFLPDRYVVPFCQFVDDEKARIMF